MSEQTPLMKQYQGIKEQFPDCILFFRVGDFYEMFGEDAKTASRILQIALTTRDKNKEDPVPMCGLPYFAADAYISKLIKAGRKVAVCEQAEDPKDAKGVMRREVVRVITPGTHTPDEQKQNSYILSFFPQGRKHGIAVSDISTGQFVLYETERPLSDEIHRFGPKEVLYPKGLGEDIFYSGILEEFFSSALEDYLFDYGESTKTMLRHFGVSSLEGFGVSGMTAPVSAAGALISYLKDTQGEGLSLKRPVVLRDDSHMFLDASTERNLELVRNLKDGTSAETLLWALDETLTPMGGRFMRGAVTRPLLSLNEIRKRLDAVNCLFADYELMETVRSGLRRLQDIERLSVKAAAGTANARDLVAIKNSVRQLPGIKKALASSGNEHLSALGGGISDFSGLSEMIEAAVVEHPPIGLKDGGLIREGFHPEVDNLRAVSTSGKDFIAALEAQEKKKTGISSLKVGYNRVFGYYIEVTKANLDLVPERYMRKQTLAGGERFITPELKDYESKVLGAEERLKALEYSVFMEVLERANVYESALMSAACAMAEVDFLASLSVVAKRHNYVMPHVDESSIIKISNGRHPVLERLQLSERFIPNDCYLDGESYKLLVITGPNMAGKSTYMRQTALCVLMAQMGSFVPADYAVVGLTDRIFTRIGASDFLTKGQSTFMVEMMETANILNNATGRSLIIIDEVGRGTSTFDGISIAWATAQFIADRINARTLFATHYNELTELGFVLEGVKNLNVSVREWGDEIIFLRKIEKGSADKSYGIHVARLAGLPHEVLEKAKAVLSNLERQEMSGKVIPMSGPQGAGGRSQLDLFAGRGDALLHELHKMNIEALSPDEAVLLLRELKRKAESIG